MLLVERFCWVTRNKEYKEYLVKRKYWGSKDASWIFEEEIGWLGWPCSFGKFAIHPS